MMDIHVPSHLVGCYPQNQCFVLDIAELPLGLGTHIFKHSLRPNSMCNGECIYIAVCHTQSDNAIGIVVLGMALFHT